jgi:hypothetical protein
LRRLRSIQDCQPVAYLGQSRMLDLRMVAPPSVEEPVVLWETGVAVPRSRVLKA